MRRVPQEPVFGTEYLFCTGKACFEHRGPLKTPSVQKKGVFMHRISLPYRRSLFFTPNASENASRTPGSLFEHGTHIPYHRWPSPVPNARQRQVAAAAEPGVHFSRPPLCYRPHCSVDKSFTGTCGGGFMQWCSTGRPHYL